MAKPITRQQIVLARWGYRGCLLSLIPLILLTNVQLFDAEFSKYSIISCLSLASGCWCFATGAAWQQKKGKPPLQSKRTYVIGTQTFIVDEQKKQLEVNHHAYSLATLSAVQLDENGGTQTKQADWRLAATTCGLGYQQNQQMGAIIGGTLAETIPSPVALIIFFHDQPACYFPLIIQPQQQAHDMQTAVALVERLAQLI